jgi:transcriptional regulator with XRE-family HTH domain
MAKVELSNMLKKLVKDRRTSVRSLSRELNIPQSTLNSMVKGSQPGSLEQLLKLSKHFGVSLEYLITGEDSRTPTLDEVLTQDVFSGWLNVTIKRAIPDKRK